MTEAGPVPHLPENGKVMAIDAKSGTATELASGGRLLVDVELGRGRTLFALAQGDFHAGNPEGSPATPHTGRLFAVGKHGNFNAVADGLNQPTSLEINRNTPRTSSRTAGRSDRPMPRAAVVALWMTALLVADATFAAAVVVIGAADPVVSEQPVILTERPDAPSRADTRDVARAKTRPPRLQPWLNRLSRGSLRRGRGVGPPSTKPLVDP